MDTKAKFQIQIQKVSDKRWFIFQPITGQVLHSIALWLVERFSGLMFWIWISYLNFALLHHRQYVHLLDKAYTAQPEVELLKVASEEIIPLLCKCSILLGLTFVEIKNSFTKTLLVFNSKNFRIICYWKKTDESEPI